MSPRFWQVRNWGEFQHYKRRSPPWIKLYIDLLQDYRFGCLPDASKAHLLCVFLLASRTKNRIPNDPAWVARQIGATDPVDLEVLAAQGFIEPLDDASTVRALGQQNAPLAEQRRGEQRRGHRSPLRTPMPSASGPGDNGGRPTRSAGAPAPTPRLRSHA